MNNGVLISVVIPTLNNRQEFLKEALNSIETQSQLPFEVIIINNGKQELKVPQTSLNIRHLKTIFRGGVAQARNFGASLAQGEYIAFLDDDDLWGQDYLKNIKIQIDKDHPDCLIGKLDQLLGDKIMPFKNAHGQINKDTILTLNPGITGSSVVINKEVFLSIGGYDPKLPPSEDKSLILELIDRGLKIVTVPESQAIARQTEIERLSRNKNKMYEGTFQFYRKYKNQMNLSQKINNLCKIYKYLWMSKKSIVIGLCYLFQFTCLNTIRLIEKLFLSIFKVK
ncbi:MAG: hypothetical protein CBE33_06760 [Candidatus Pelagibacter sp. TMED273]|nr:MAG: hypothetical protein CBE33_06760 [Candidatus Pelagibacter sp. TMED273]|tara:strand:- start:5180 stop:6025 length:846 start_codon:yes stop_codon:yes gene_type:complete